MPASTWSIDAPGAAVVVGGALVEVVASSSSRAAISASVRRRSLSRRTSLPRLWQYQKTNRRTLYACQSIGCAKGYESSERNTRPWKLLTKQSKRIEHIHAEERRESKFEEIHDRLQHGRDSARFCYQILQTRHSDLQPGLRRSTGSHICVFRIETMLFGCCG